MDLLRTQAKELYRRTMTERQKEEDRIFRVFRERAIKDAADQANQALAYLSRLAREQSDANGP
jgi:hypothetical protein